uniref:Cyclic nucleotide-binding domain-containing protein n=1 Tax=Globisporangium ultimum (strain ATCC 200006 / CBS 805.95 / DAOM BR144) TaxID=431595 RepID=K3WZY9_GLOUD
MRAKALTAEDQDELAYFSQRIGNSDFKLARRLVIHPHGRTRAFWDTILMVLISWILVVVPLELSFKELDPHIRRTLLRFDLFVDSMFAIDIFLNFNTGIESDGKLHFSFRSIYRHYLRSWFFPDVIWTLPLYAFVEFKDPHTYSSHATLSRVAQTHTWLYTCFRCIRFLRVFELPHLQRRLEYSLLISSKISSLGSFMYVVVALSHVFSCMFAYLAFGDQEHLAIAIESNLLESDNLQTKYIASFYWSMMTMTTVGYGDITVRTNTGRLFSLAAMVVGGGIFAYGISNVVALFQQLYVDETEHRHKMDNVNTFMHSRSLPRKLRDEIRANFFHMRKATRESKQHDYEIFQQMSRTLQSNVATLFCQEMMPRKMPFLAGCNAEFIHELYLSMEVRCYLPGEDIIRQDDYGTEMYFLFVGHVQVFLSHTKVAALGPSAFFGEFGIFNPKKPRLATIQALDFCETHCIQRRELFRILVCHPFMLRTIQQLAVLRSRKALNILYESGGKSRTLLQGLASMWHQEGILALFPRGIVTAKDEFPSLQEYLPPMPTTSSPDAAGRRASFHKRI